VVDVTCNNCGWVHFGIARKSAEEEVENFNLFYDSLNEERKSWYSGKSKIENYEKCFNCGGGYENFRKSKNEDCPVGCTIQPIIYEEI